MEECIGKGSVAKLLEKKYIRVVIIYRHKHATALPDFQHKNQTGLLIKFFLNLIYPLEKD